MYVLTSSGVPDHRQWFDPYVDRGAQRVTRRQREAAVTEWRKRAPINAENPRKMFSDCFTTHNKLSTTLEKVWCRFARRFVTYFILCGHAYRPT